jgi:hypothetical protein
MAQLSDSFGGRKGEARASTRGGEDTAERLADALSRTWIAQQALGVVVREDGAVDLMSKLVAIEIGVEMSFFGGRTSYAGEQLQPVALLAHQFVTSRPFLIVEFWCRGYE